MANTQIKDPHIKALFAEVAATKLLLRVLIERSLPADQAEAWKQIEAIVGRIEEIARASTVGGMRDDSSQKMVQVAAQIATDFVRPIGPAPKSQ